MIWEFNSPLEYSPGEPRSPADIEASIARLRQAAVRVDAAVCVTRQSSNQARELLGIQNTHVIQNASDPEVFRRDLPLPKDFSPNAQRMNVVFMASGRESNHDVPLICEAGRRVAKLGLPIDIHIFGRSSDMFPSNLGNAFHIYGPVSYLELPKYLAAMDVGLVLYRNYADGLSSLKLFDYLASGCVPFCSDSQPIHEVLDGTEAGIIQSWSADTLCEALLALHHDRDRLERMREAGRQLIVREYSWRRVAEKTVEIVRGTDRYKRWHSR